MRNGTLSPFHKMKLDAISDLWSRLERKFDLHTAAEFLARQYGWVITALGSVIIALETIEHLTPERSNGFFYGEIVLVVLLLLAAGLLIRTLLAALSERSRAMHVLHLKHELGKDLSACHDVSEVRTRLEQHFAALLPSVEVKLVLFGPNGGASAPDASGVCTLSGADLEVCRHCILRQPSALRSLDDCPQPEYAQGYCLPLVQGTAVVGMLHLQPHPNAEFTLGQVELLENIVDEITGSLYSAIQKKAWEEEALQQKIRGVQLEIARDLHDTIGQNISYLRLKLDHLSAAAEAPTVPTADIRKMNEVANESYDLVRGTLALLQSEGSANLRQLFTRFSQQVEDRSGIQIDLNILGQPRALTPNAMRQLFYIFREALSNIEKYSGASHVKVEMAWQERSLRLAIEDDGCGFDQDCVPSGHYGLAFMRQRAEQIHGTFSVHSTVGRGTRILVQVPCE